MKTSQPPSPTASKPDCHYRSLLLWAVLTAFAIRMVVVGFVYQGFLDPGRDHWEFGYELGKIAYSIAHGHGFSDPYWVETGPTAMITPVFPYLMSWVFKLFGDYTKAAVFAMLTFNCLTSALTCIPIFYLARTSFGLRTAIAAAWTWAFFPYAIYFSADSMWYHSLVALLLTLLLLIASSLEKQSRLLIWAGFGILWGVAALTTPVVLAVLPFLTGWVCYRLQGHGKSWKLPLATAVFALFVTLAPWLIRNYRVFHQPVFLKDNFWMEVCIGNLGNATHWWNDAAHPAGSNTELTAFQQLGELGYMRRERRQALVFIQSYPGIFLWRSIRRVVYMWTGFWSVSPEYLRGEPLDLANIFFCTVFTAFAMIGLYKSLRGLRDAAMPYAVVLFAFPLVYYFTHSEISYRLPIEPELVIFACFAVVSWQKRVPDIASFGKKP
ncbi:MAG: glycosyltransferase family 39 protein [Terriglobales bacterium]